MRSNWDVGHFTNDLHCVCHGTCDWVMSHANESCHTMNESCHMASVSEEDVWRSHGTYEWVMSHMNGLCRIWTSHVGWCGVFHGTCECAMVHTNESCHTMTESWHMQMRHVMYERAISRRNRSSQYEWVISYHDWVISKMSETCQIWMSHGGTSLLYSLSLSPSLSPSPSPPRSRSRSRSRSLNTCFWARPWHQSEIPVALLPFHPILYVTWLVYMGCEACTCDITRHTWYDTFMHVWIDLVVYHTTCA